MLIEVLSPSLGDDFPEILFERLRAIRIHRSNHALRPTLPTDGQNRWHIAPDKENRLIALKLSLEFLRMTFIFILVVFDLIALENIDAVLLGKYFPQLIRIYIFCSTFDDGQISRIAAAKQDEGDSVHLL